jgi:ribosomal protein L29
MKKKTFKGTDHKELKTMLDEKSKKLRDFKFDMTAGKNKNVKEGREIRKDIARILTELNSVKA